VASRNISGVEQQFQTDAGGPAPGTTAIDRGAELLVRVLESAEPVALTEVAAAAGIPKSTASRLITALERRGLVEQVGERGRLRAGPAILRVAERGLLERNLMELGRPALDALAELSGETVNLAVPGPGGVEHLAQAESKHFLGAGQWVGRTVQYHASANGKVFLAFGRAAMPISMSAYTPATITDAERLTAELETVRSSGFASAVDELEPGLAAIAAPVRGAHGDVIAALSITGPALRMSPKRIAELRPALIDEANRLGVRLGPRDQGEKAA
jgi:IclR family transcriptional regulator, acetate operon repressor